MSVSSQEVEVVLAWHAALNAGDTDRLVALSTADVEVGGPRGAGRGAELLREWVERARIQLEPVRWRARAEHVVVEQNASWQTSEAETTEPQTLASAFRVEGGKVASVVRYADFESAVESARLDGPSQG